mgnify:CR=1 FL=1
MAMVVSPEISGFLHVIVDRLSNTLDTKSGSGGGDGWPVRTSASAEQAERFREGRTQIGIAHPGLELLTIAMHKTACGEEGEASISIPPPT